MLEFRPGQMDSWTRMAHDPFCGVRTALGCPKSPRRVNDYNWTRCDRTTMRFRQRRHGHWADQDDNNYIVDGGIGAPPGVLARISSASDARLKSRPNTLAELRALTM